MELTCRHFSILIWWLMYAVACYICLVQKITVTLLFGERLRFSFQMNYFIFDKISLKDPLPNEKRCFLWYHVVWYMILKHQTELITQPLYQSIVIRYLESCKHTLSRQNFCKSFVYNLLYGLRAPQHPLITQSRPQLSFGSYHCYVTCCFGQR